MKEQSKVTRTLSDNERVRIAQTIERHRIMLASIELTLGCIDGPSTDAIQAFAHSASDVICALSRLQAFLRSEGKTE